MNLIKLLKQKDKQKHFLAGAFISIIMTILLCWWIGLLLSVVVGLMKETYDMAGNGTPEWNDVLATIIGGICGNVITLVFYIILAII